MFLLSLLPFLCFDGPTEPHRLRRVSSDLKETVNSRISSKHDLMGPWKRGVTLDIADVMSDILLAWLVIQSEEQESTSPYKMFFRCV